MPDGKGDKNGQTPKATPQTPKPVLTIPELKAKMKATVEKVGVCVYVYIIWKYTCQKQRLDELI